jgi:hypothetical protein
MLQQPAEVNTNPWLLMLRRSNVWLHMLAPDHQEQQWFTGWCSRDLSLRLQMQGLQLQR